MQMGQKGGQEQRGEEGSGSPRKGGNVAHLNGSSNSPSAMVLVCKRNLDSFPTPARLSMEHSGSSTLQYKEPLTWASV